MIFVQVVRILWNTCIIYNNVLSVGMTYIIYLKVITLTSYVSVMIFATILQTRMEDFIHMILKHMILINFLFAK